MQQRKPRLDNKVALVLGASRENNMGQAIARAFAAEGAKVVVAGRQEAPLRILAEEIDGAWTKCDITDKEQIEAMVAFAKERYGKLDIGVNAAATGILKPFEEHTGEDIDEMTAVLFKGPFQLLQVLVREMGPGSSIINLSSAAATIGYEHHMAYTGAKAGMEQVVRAVANEYGHKGIRVNTIAPGLTVTPMLGNMDKTPGLIDAFIKEYPLGRLNTIEDIAHAAVFLASDECFMTGQTLQVNGGLTLRRNPTLAEIQRSIEAAVAQ
ncbi:SDR family NAD(P)-dependent oxidoreductase [Pseudomonas citronellolis]|uniref:SDR family NAD(P)-dependent oxidoreductase n=1 Tax=Pseudomonas citronellolis TaxID=53408 RepID=UPI0021C2231E|nr:SDR family oxidoreductase [Pseudomonas citronellolis]UXJ50285.1 SDR family oxidoreductase [Pseudomonas citronellolis]